MTAHFVIRLKNQRPHKTINSLPTFKDSTRTVKALSQSEQDELTQRSQDQGKINPSIKGEKVNIRVNFRAGLLPCKGY